MKPPRQMSREQWRLLIVFILLAMLVAVLWFNDPSHLPAGKSRVDWPSSVPVKP